VAKCGNVNRDTKPCDGTYACLCKHDDKEFYRVSKTMPVVPTDYTGLNTTLFDTYLLKIDDGSSNEEEEEDISILKIAVIVGATAVGTIILCCIGYYICLYCASRAHRVTYIEHTPKKKKESTAKVPKQPINKKPA